MRSGILIALIAASFSHADDAPRFEVATLKQAPAPTGNYPITLGLTRGTRLTFTNVTLGDCVKFAWGLVSNDQFFGPDWIDSKANLYDIEALVPADAPRELVMRMTQTLLAERLGLRVHHEERTMKYLALVPGKGEVKMRAADLSQERNNSSGRGRVTGNRASMGLVALLVSRMEHQIVIDQTGLTGEYQVALQWAPGSGGTDTAQEDSTAPSLFAAVQEQLGLKLESRKGPLDVIVIDHAEKVPAEN